jgi:Flp pilus assembly protein TadG
MTLRKNPEHGVSLVLFTLLTALVVIPIVGLGVDGAIVFWAKAKLSAAVDAAALAAGRSPSASPQLVATQYVNANFPPGWMRSTFVSGPTATVGSPSLGTRSITVTASVSVPTFFMGILGYPYSIVAASAASAKRDANIILVLDRSSSMNITFNGVNVCSTMKSSAQTFVNFFADNSVNMGLITFTAGANVDFPFSRTFQSNNPNLNYYIGNLVCSSNTSSAMALNLAYQQIQSLGSSAQSSNGVLNVIVFFTDGQPNGLTADYPIRQALDNRYSPTSTGTLASPLALGATPALCASNAVNNPLTGLTGVTGVIAQWAGGAKPTGTTEGLFQLKIPPLSSGSCPGLSICNGATPIIPAVAVTPGVSGAGCTFLTQNNGAYMRQDIAYIPLRDHFNNSTNGYMTQPSDWVTTGPYANLGFRTDVPQALSDAAFNAADAQAQAIIHDTHGYDPVIYTIGLGGATDAPTEATFTTFLERAANDPRANNYDSTRPAGQFVYAPNASQLSNAFQQVAAQILRLYK